MPRAMKDLQGLCTNGDRVAMLQPAIRHERLCFRHASHLTGLRQHLYPEFIFALRPLHRNTQRLAQFQSCGTVVHVAMGNKNFLDFSFQLRNAALDALQVTTGINNRSLTGFFAPDDGAILLVRGDRDDDASQ